ncbi:oxygenase MpaB family protein [Aspergillus lucknowensis]|uniref:ER-bound oxygenase mpaB/mpaB'/Rubber oxygenase catalytic domain-containing protein n=1 Tax=Aspergillus lucknowensis TaxID=176173 RepID=A0ABR4LFC4_9EURO
MAGPDIRTHWDISFEWTGLHRTPEQLRPMTLTYDKLADECIARLNELSPREKYRPYAGQPATKAPKRDLLALLEQHANDDPKLQELWTEINTVPDWVEWDQIKRGQEVFFRYGMPILNVLSFQSLLGGMGANRVVETLARTGGFSADVVRRRLLETLQHILQVSLSLDSIKPGGSGHQSSVRVRLLHSSVRSRILSLAKEKPEYFDIEAYGIPISDLDCIGTINTFSTSVVWIGLPRQGIYLKEKEIDDYIALWRLVAYYMGTPHDVLADKPTAKAFMESILACEVDPKPIGQVLAKNIVIGLENTAPSFASKEFIEAMARHLNGDKLADRLDIPKTSLYYQTLVYGYCYLAVLIAYLNRAFPLFDKAWIAVRRQLYYALITDKEHGLGGETIFDFKYVPWFTRTTKLGTRRVRKSTKVGVELLAQLGVLVACASAAAVVYGALAGVRLLGQQRLLPCAW